MNCSLCVSKSRHNSVLDPRTTPCGQHYRNLTFTWWMTALTWSPYSARIIDGNKINNYFWMLVGKL